MFYPNLNAPGQSVLTTTVFAGYDHNPRGRDGTFYHMTNITGRAYPLAAAREPRRKVWAAAKPRGLVAKDALYWVDGDTLYANGLAVEGLRLDPDTPKQLISMGAYLVIWPDRMYVNTQDLTDFGSMDQRYQLAQGQVTLTPCQLDGTPYEVEAASLSPVPPESPGDGALWVNTAEPAHTLHRYSAALGEWTAIPTVYLRIAAPGIGKGFAAGDGVTLSDLSYTGDSADLSHQVEQLNGDTLLQKAEEDAVTIVGLLDQALTLTSVTLKREAPAMDYLCEANNRLWGCFYGLKDGKPVNEIYASSLGDFKNWRAYAGLSTDSYAVSLGSDGVFTGAVNYQGCPTFFKETCLHRVYGATPGSFQLQTTTCRGVEKGSAASLCQVGETLYYKGRTQVMAYDGSLPQPVSHALGDERYTAGVGGAWGSLYYLAMKDAAGGAHLFVYDTDRGFWHREDDLYPLAFTPMNDDLYALTEEGIYALSGGDEKVSWSLTTAVAGYEYPEQKYLSRWLIRAAAEAGEKVTVSFQYDSSGVWETAGELTGQGMARTFLVPVIPRRCDHLQLRLEGAGSFKLYSLSRVLEQGGDPV